MRDRRAADADNPADTDSLDSAVSATSPQAAVVPTPSEVHGTDNATGYVVWHRKHLRTADQLALTRAVSGGDVVCPLLVFDPAFYGDGGLACDARIRFFHEAVASLDRLYAAAPAPTVTRTAEAPRERLAATTPLSLNETREDDRTAEDSLSGASSPGLTIGYGSPPTVLQRFANKGWTILTMATPTSRYGKRRDDRVRDVCGNSIEFISGDGLVRGQEWSRTNWQTHVETWLNEAPHTPAWSTADTTQFVLETGITPAAIDAAFDISPSKTLVPTGTHRRAAERLRSFVERIHSYPGNISAPQDAREASSGLSPYLNFGLLSVRQVYQSVSEQAPECRGRQMFTDRLVWNLHYNQKLVDWPGWTDTAVNPVFEDFNRDHHDPELVQAWKGGETGFPMVDAAMRCLRQTGWLNFRMRAMCASFFVHILQQPWWIGADWYHHHLIDSDVGINYTQWQSQAGTIGKPVQRVYNPRKQVRDHDPDGDWICRWLPELAPLPNTFLDRPERTPLAVQTDCGVTIGDDYPRPVVDFDARREAFWSRYERHHPAAARQLARPEIAKRASFSGGYDAAKSIAAEYGDSAEDSAADMQLSLSDAASLDEAADAAEDEMGGDGTDES
ncbi:deoxyribodipyrimidine photolyase (plasmid) [Natronomonas pharaonis DSM 2160]|uniref:Deoxyribodipyrimidine photolyase n=1 Tax=Natronomonas pharaonis (strain ATCC 35678 / DSM 2160 / CIP 103997 / JCM 8858 / NBRC 14720 / NCIMB 2260 / Gabara) TaxID=348780 RepID=Q3ILY4_NATPD|nr:cryptochrome/deoxyribodipyrimidine photo-lyase family protein [Natronomonas pharaonis]CAI50885.2 deoxyribodipyrimidine photolyase [Natronomonas pharaonis DSM 2160]